MAVSETTRIPKDVQDLSESAPKIPEKMENTQKKTCAAEVAASNHSDNSKIEYAAGAINEKPRRRTGSFHQRARTYA